MREHWTTIEGKVPVLRRWSQSAQDFPLTPIERAVILATIIGQPASERHLGNIVCREFTGYGAFLHFKAPGTESSGRLWVGSAMLNWIPPTRQPISSVACFTGDSLELLELFPSDGDAWTIADMQAILAAPLDRVYISPGAGHR